MDNLFAANEAAIDLEEIKRESSSRFDFIEEEYKGNIAYLFVLNSLVVRVPLRLKAIYSRVLLWLESRIQKLQGKTLSCFVVCQWKKIAPDNVSQEELKQATVATRHRSIR